MGFVGMPVATLTLRPHAQIQISRIASPPATGVIDSYPASYFNEITLLTMCCLRAEFNWGGVKRCDPTGNSWCCDGRGPDRDEDCCQTNRTTSLEPYPYSITDIIIPPKTATTSAYSAAAITLSSSVSISSGAKVPAIRSDTSVSGLSSSRTPISNVDPSTLSTTTMGQNIAESSQNENNNRKTNSHDGLSKSDLISICIGLPVGIATIVSTILLFISYSRKRN